MPQLKESAFEKVFGGYFEYCRKIVIQVRALILSTAAITITNIFAGLAKLLFK